MSSYLEHFIESTQQLPQDLNRNLSLVRALDIKVEDTVKSINIKYKYYLQNAEHIPKEEKSEILDSINALYDKALVDSENKRELVHQTYNLIDKHIRVLDSELAKLDNEFVESGDAKLTDVNEKDSKKRNQKSLKVKMNKSSIKSSFKVDAEKCRKRSDSCSKGVKYDVPKRKIGPTTDLLDMEVDPNEPRYCLCHQVSFGEMVGCDEADCPLEWFHFQCVGLTSKPKGKWYCPDCTQKKKSKISL